MEAGAVTHPEWWLANGVKSSRFPSKKKKTSVVFSLHMSILNRTTDTNIVLLLC